MLQTVDVTPKHKNKNILSCAHTQKMIKTTLTTLVSHTTGRTWFYILLTANVRSASLRKCGWQKLQHQKKIRADATDHYGSHTDMYVCTIFSSYLHQTTARLRKLAFRVAVSG